MSLTTLEHDSGPVERALTAPTARPTLPGAEHPTARAERRSRDVVVDPGAAPSRGPGGGSRPSPAGPTGQPSPRTARPPRERPRTGPTTAHPGPRVRLVPAMPQAAPPIAAAPPHTVPPSVRSRIDALRAADRSTVVEASDEPRGPVPDADPRHTSGAVAHAVLEVLAGTRPLAQLARWVTPGVYEALRTRTELTVRVLGVATGRRPLVRRVRVCAVDPHAAEATVIAHDGQRVRAVALRLETHRGAWRVTALEVG
ncbi:Rv3235 family protein [Cellulomonas soli]